MGLGHVPGQQRRHPAQAEERRDEGRRGRRGALLGLGGVDRQQQGDGDSRPRPSWRAISCSARSTRLSSLPLSVRGSSSRTDHDRGRLNPARRSARKASRAAGSTPARPGRHDSVDPLAPLVVGHAEHGRVVDVGMGVEHGLHLGRVDVHPAGDDHVGPPVADVQVALVVEPGHVATDFQPPGSSASARRRPW